MAEWVATENQSSIAEYHLETWLANTNSNFRYALVDHRKKQGENMPDIDSVCHRKLIDRFTAATEQACDQGKGDYNKPKHWATLVTSQALYFHLYLRSYMSQNKVYEALKEIGGEGTTAELRDHISEKFPDLTLSDYAVNRLRQLEDKNVVDIDDSSTPFYVRITDENWDGVRESLADRDFPPDSNDEQ
jgi:hypothetical protein